MKIISTIIMMAALAITAWGETIYVAQQGGGDYTTITNALLAAGPGDVIIVEPGVYAEALQLDETVTLKSESGPEVTTITGSATLITVLSGSNMSVIEGFTLTGSNGNGVYSSSGSGGSAKIINCRIYNISGSSIYFENHPAHVLNCLIHDNLYHGIYFKENNADGIIANNTVFDNGQNGIYLNNGADPDVYNNIAYNNNWRGIDVDDGTDGNIIYNNAYGNSTNYQGFNIGPTNLSFDPLFVGYPDDLHLLHPLSPCIDTGRPEPEYNDPNGTRSDMGVYGSVQCWGGGAPGITEIEVTPVSVPQGETINVEASGTVH